MGLQVLACLLTFWTKDLIQSALKVIHQSTKGFITNQPSKGLHIKLMLQKMINHETNVTTITVKNVIKKMTQ